MRNAHQCVITSQSSLSVHWMDQHDPQTSGGWPTFKCSFCPRFCQTFAPYLSGRLPTTPKKRKSCSCGATILAGIVTSGESGLDQRRLFNKSRPMPSRPWRGKECISIWVHRCVPRWSPSYSPDSTTGVDIKPMSAFYALAVAFPFSLQQPSGAIAVSWKWNYIWGIRIMI